jgi:glutathione S-transferase
MSPMLSQPAFQAYAASCGALTVGMYALGMLTGHFRKLKPLILNQEDSLVYKGASLADHEDPSVQRAKRVHMNLIESALPFFAIGLVYAMTDPSVTMARVLFFGFVAVRVLHAAFYLMKMQPARVIAFAGGMLVNLVMVVQVLRAVV